MSRALNYERASKRDRQRNAKLRDQAAAMRKQRDKKQERYDERQATLAHFAYCNRLACFKCGNDSTEWAKSGWSKRGPWIICTTCVNR